MKNGLYGYYAPKDDDIEHSGIKGQKWGVRNYQNPDGTLTAEGRARYGKKSKGKSTNKTKDESVHKYAGGSRYAGVGLRNVKTGKDFVKWLFLGPVNTTLYNDMKADGISRGRRMLTVLFGI